MVKLFKKIIIVFIKKRNGEGLEDWIILASYVNSAEGGFEFRLLLLQFVL